MRLVIIGNSAAGIFAAEAIRESDSRAQIVMISDEPQNAYSRCLISYEWAGSLASGRLGIRDRAFYEKNVIETRFGKRAVQLIPEERRVILEDDESVGYDRLLLATGGIPNRPKVPGIEREGVFPFRTADDLDHITAFINSAERGIVLGGGCVGLQAVAGLHHHGLRAAISIDSAHLLSQVADAQAGAIVERRCEKEGIAVKKQVKIREIMGEKRVTSILFENGDMVPCDIIILGKGVKPNLELVRGTSIQTHDGILVDDHLRSSDEHIYAAGDVAETIDIVTGERTVNALWPCASEQGRIAGLNMAGGDVTYEGSMRMNAMEFFGLSLISLGTVRPRGDGFEILSRHQPEKEHYRKIVLKDNRIIGAILMGTLKNAGVVTMLMKNRVDVSAIKSALLHDRLNYAHILPLLKEGKGLSHALEHREMWDAVGS